MRELNISEIDGVIGGDATVGAGCTTDKGQTVSNGFTLVTPIGDKGFAQQTCSNGDWVNFKVTMFAE